MDIINRYGLAHRDWYTNQSSVEKARRAKRLESQAKQYACENGEEERFYEEHWSTVGLTPEK